MDFIEQLWTLKQIYQNENAYYDPSRKQHLHHIPSNIPAEKLDILKQTGRMPNQILYPRHDEIWDAFYTLADTWTLSEAADAFIAGLWSAPFLWQSALNAKLLSGYAPPCFYPLPGLLPHLYDLRISGKSCGFHAAMVQTHDRRCPPGR